MQMYEVSPLGVHATLIAMQRKPAQATHVVLRRTQLRRLCVTFPQPPSCTHGTTRRRGAWRARARVSHVAAYRRVKATTSAPRRTDPSRTGLRCRRGCPVDIITTLSHRQSSDRRNIPRREPRGAGKGGSRRGSCTGKRLVRAALAAAAHRTPRTAGGRGSFRSQYTEPTCANDHPYGQQH